MSPSFCLLLVTTVGGSTFQVLLMFFLPPSTSRDYSPNLSLLKKETKGRGRRMLREFQDEDGGWRVERMEDEGGGFLCLCMEY